MFKNIVFVVHDCTLDFDFPELGCNPYVDFLCGNNYLFFNKKEILPSYIDYFGTKNSKQRTFKRKLNKIFPTKSNNFKELACDLKKRGVTILFRCPVSNIKVENIILAAHRLGVDFSVLLLTQPVTKSINYDFYLQYIDFYRPDLPVTTNPIDIKTYCINCMQCTSRYSIFLKQQSIDLHIYDTQKLKNDQQRYNIYKRLFESNIDHDTFIKNINSVTHRCETKMKKCNYTLATLGEMLND